jgi:hypothetical protein
MHVGFFRQGMCWLVFLGLGVPRLLLIAFHFFFFFGIKLTLNIIIKMIFKSIIQLRYNIQINKIRTLYDNINNYFYE